MQSERDNSGKFTLYRADLVADGFGALHAPGSLLVRGRQVVGVGRPEQVGMPAGADVVQLSNAAVIPALVNAHTHLDLTGCGCWAYEGDFDAWLGRVLLARQEMTAASVDAYVQQGVRALLMGGVAAVGDIAGPWATEAGLRHTASSGLGGVIYSEVFGMGARRDAVLQEVAGLAAKRVPGQGLQPHAPYSSHGQVFRAALRSGMSVSTHLAESPEELEFLHAGTGRFRQFLERLGAWNGEVIAARHPVDWLAALMAECPGARILCAHCNYVDDAALRALAAAPLDVVYCPRSSEYFGHRGHRYREMLDAGVCVALGTDSMICLDTPDRLSTLDELRLLMRRDGLSLTTALAMATVHGARALGLPQDSFTLAATEGPKAGILRVPLQGAAQGSVADLSSAFAASSSAPAWILGPGAELETEPRRAAAAAR